MGELANADWRWLADSFVAGTDTTWDEEGASGFDFTPHANAVWLPKAPSGDKYVYMPDLATGRKFTVTASALDVDWPDIRFRIHWPTLARGLNGSREIIANRASTTTSGWSASVSIEIDGDWGILLTSYVNSTTSRIFQVPNISTAPTTDADGWVWIRIEAVDGGNDNLYTSTDGSTWGAAVASAAGWAGAASAGTTDGLFGGPSYDCKDIACTEIVLYEQGEGTATFHWRAQDHDDLLTAETSYVGGATVTPVGAWVRGYHPVLMTDEVAAWAGDGYMHHTMANSPEILSSESFTHVIAIKEFDLSSTSDSNNCDLFKHTGDNANAHIQASHDATDNLTAFIGADGLVDVPGLDFEEWRLYAITRDGDTDAQLWEVTDTGATSLGTDSSLTVRTGSIGGTGNTLEVGDDGTNRTRQICTGLAIWDVELTQSELAGLYADFFGSTALNATITGAVTVGVAVASTMAYTGSGDEYDITGAVPITVTVAGAFEHGWDITGSITVTPTIAAAMFYGADITGGVVVNIAVAADMAYLAGNEIAGDITVNLAIAGGMDYTASTFDYDITGDITVEVAVAADLDFAVELEGDITINIAVASGMSYGKSLFGTVPVTVVPGSATDYTFIREIEGDVTVNIGIRGRTAGSVVMTYLRHQKMHVRYTELEI